jgi:hypothetical protein
VLWYAVSCTVRRAVVVLVAMMLLIALPTRVSAQEQSSGFGDTVKRVVFDPTTYAPAAIAYDATMRDWNTSQPFFRNGYFERNARFTISGRPNDVPVSYSVGRTRIIGDALSNLQLSLVHNVADQIIERTLIERYPHRRKLIRTIGWIERIGFASAMSYYLSAQHYQQASDNAARAQQLGFR